MLGVVGLPPLSCHKGPITPHIAYEKLSGFKYQGRRRQSKRSTQVPFTADHVSTYLGKWSTGTMVKAWGMLHPQQLGGRGRGRLNLGSQVLAVLGWGVALCQQMSYRVNYEGPLTLQYTSTAQWHCSTHLVRALKRQHWTQWPTTGRLHAPKYARVLFCENEFGGVGR